MLRNIPTIFVCLILSLSISAQQKKYGLFVGIGDYPDKKKQLLSSGNDADKICQAFSKECGGINARLLKNAQATRQNILDDLKNYQTLTKSGDLFVFYFSGHGTLFPDWLSEDVDEGPMVNTDGIKYYDTALVPYDSEEGTSGKSWKNLILDDELYDLFEEFADKGVQVVFISDSCHAGGLAKSTFGVDEKLQAKLGAPKFISLKSAIGRNENEIMIPKTQKGVTRKDLDRGYILIASSAEDELSYSQNPETGPENSLFTYCLLKVFDELHTKKKELTFNDIKTLVIPKVRQIAKENMAIQTPYLNVRFYGKGRLDIPVF